MTTSHKKSSRRSTWGKILLSLGVISLIISAIFMALGYLWAKELNSLQEDNPTLKAGVTSVKLEKDAERGIYAPKSSVGKLTCTAVGPDGKKLDKPVDEEITLTIKDKEYQRIGVFSTTAAGEQTITCQGDGAQDAFIGKNLTTGDVGRGVLSIIISIVTGLLGALLALIGLIMWLTGRKRHA